MNQKALILAVGILAGAAVVYFIPRGTNNTEPAAHDTVAVAPEPPAPAPAPEAPPAPQPKPVAPPTPPPAVVVNPPPAPVSAWARLAEKYGPEKTALSHKVTSNLTSVITQGLELANTAARNSGATNLAQAASREILRNAAVPLALSDDQKQRVGELIQSSVNKRLGAVNDLTSAMSSEPEQIMELMLAGDALSRKEITQDQYDRLTQPTRAMLQNVTGFLTGQPGAGGIPQLMLDPTTASELNAILTPDQQAKLAEMTAAMAQQVAARQAANTNNAFQFQPGQIPVMDLSRLDQSVSSMKQMADAAKMMMEAMKGMQDANSTGGTR